MKKCGRRTEEEKEEKEVPEDGTKEAKDMEEKEDTRAIQQADGIKEEKASEEKEDTRTMDTREERPEEEKEICIGVKAVTKSKEAPKDGSRPIMGADSCSASRVCRSLRRRD